MEQQVAPAANAVIQQPQVLSPAKPAPVEMQRVQQLQPPPQAEQPAPTTAVAAGVTTATATLAPVLRSQLLLAGRLAAEGRYSEADARFTALLAATPAPAEQAQVRLAYADTLNRLARLTPRAVPGGEIAVIGGLTTTLDQRAAELYRQALPRLSGEARAKAANNLAALYLRQRRPGEALAILEQATAEAGTLRPDQRARLAYNLGRALEESGRRSEALARYLESAGADPAFDAAHEAAGRLVAASTDLGRQAEFLLEWCNQVLDRGQEPGQRANLELAATILRRLTATKVEPWAVRGIGGTLCRLLARQGLPPDAYRERWQPQLARLAAMDPSLARAEADLEYLYFDNRTPDFDFRRAPQTMAGLLAVFPGGRPEQEVSGLAGHVARHYESVRDWQRGLAGHALAWALDTSNTASAYRAVALLQQHASEIADADTVLRRFTTFLFRGKGRAYLGEDWPNILRYHLVLATIYVGRREWGDPWTPTSAIFQLEHAIEAHRRLAAVSPLAAGAIARVKQELGHAYDMTGDRRRAGRAYLDGFETALTEKDPETARAILAVLAEQPATYGLRPETVERLAEMLHNQG